MRWWLVISAQFHLNQTGSHCLNCWPGVRKCSCAMKVGDIPFLVLLLSRGFWKCSYWIQSCDLNCLSPWCFRVCIGQRPWACEMNFLYQLILPRVNQLLTCCQVLYSLQDQRLAWLLQNQNEVENLLTILGQNIFDLSMFDFVHLALLLVRILLQWQKERNIFMDKNSTYLLDGCVSCVYFDDEIRWFVPCGLRTKRIVLNPSRPSTLLLELRYHKILPTTAAVSQYKQKLGFILLKLINFQYSKGINYDEFLSGIYNWFPSGIWNRYTSLQEINLYFPSKKLMIFAVYHF